MDAKQFKQEEPWTLKSELELLDEVIAGYPCRRRAGWISPNAIVWCRRYLKGLDRRVNGFGLREPIPEDEREAVRSHVLLKIAELAKSFRASA